MVNDRALAERIYLIQKSTGGILSPNESWLLIRGIKTLAVRMDRHMENAAKIVAYLKDHPLVKKIFYPGIETHPGHDIQLRQAKAFGAVVSFVIEDTLKMDTFVRHLETITFGESLGGVESLLTHPETMTHGAIPFELRQKMGIVHGLFRLSVGIEHSDDLIGDLEQALTKANA